MRESAYKHIVRIGLGQGSLNHTSLASFFTRDCVINTPADESHTGCKWDFSALGAMTVSIKSTFSKLVGELRDAIFLPLNHLTHITKSHCYFPTSPQTTLKTSCDRGQFHFGRSWENFSNCNFIR